MQQSGIIPDANEGVMTEKDSPTTPDRPKDEVVGEGQDAELEQEFFDGEERTMQELKAEAEAEARGKGGRAGGSGNAKTGDDDEGEQDWVEGEEELRRIMAPKKSARHPFLAAAVVVASGVGIWWLWSDLVYFFRGRTPVNLGQAKDAVRRDRLRPNRYVTLKGTPLPQTMASGNHRSVFGGPADSKVQFFILASTHYRVVVKGPKIKHIKKGATPKLYGTYTGRLRRLDDTRSGPGVRRYYLNRSKISGALRPFHRVPGKEVLDHVGTAHALLTDLKGERFEVRGDTLLELFISFPGEYELDVHTDVRDPLDGVEARGGDGASACGAPVSVGSTASLAASGKGKAPPAAMGATPAPRRAPPARRTVAKRPAPGAKAPARPAPAKGAKLRLRGWGGSVYLRPDPKVFTLDGIARAGSLEAAAGANAADRGEPASGADLIVPVPKGTQVFNAQPRDCKRACRWEGPTCLKACSTDKGVEIRPDGKLILVAAGGDCRGGKGERHVINLRARPFKNAKRATAYVKSLGFPWRMVEDNSKTTSTVHFIVKMPAEAAHRMIKHQTKSSPYNLSARYEVFRVKWRDLMRQGDELVFKRTLRGYPRSNEVVKIKGQPRLRPVPLGVALRVASSRVMKADITQLLRLPDDAYLLEVGVKPQDMWFEPFVPGAPVFALLLLLFIVLNLLAIRAYFRG